MKKKFIKDGEKWPTLMGAVNTEIGNHTLGEYSYEKAIERGANEKSVDDDLWSIFMRAEPAKR